jgi:hypothetical protein
MGCNEWGPTPLKIAGPRLLEQAGVLDRSPHAPREEFQIVALTLRVRLPLAERAGYDHLIRSVTVSFSLIALLVAAAPDWSNW